jgi:cyanate permease
MELMAGHTRQTNRYVHPPITVLVSNSKSLVEPSVSACPPHIQRISNHALAFVFWRFKHLEFARRDAMAIVPATPDLATMASIINTVLRSQVIVTTKTFSLRSSVLAWLPQLLKSLGFSEAVVGQMGFFSTIAGAAFSIPSSRLIDRFRKYKEPLTFILLPALCCTRLWC